VGLKKWGVCVVFNPLLPGSLLLYPRLVVLVVS